MRKDNYLVCFLYKNMILVLLSCLIKSIFVQIYCIFVHLLIKSIIYNEESREKQSSR
jgi:hypothetical protein